jgi:hypothetical protein
MSDEPILLPMPLLRAPSISPMDLIAQLESRQDEVLRDLDQLIARLESVLASYTPPATPATSPIKAA